MWFILKYLLAILDKINQIKIYNFIKNILGNKLSFVLDVGSHHGETIKILNKYFKINSIFGFEPSRNNFSKLNRYILDAKIQNVEIFNFACGKENKEEILNYSAESSSSTINKINENSKYFKKKKLIIQGFSSAKFFKPEKIQVKKLDDFLVLNNKKIIDLVKIDTEGYEIDVLIGMEENLNNTKMIYFEHHYDNMIQKNYTFSDINNFLNKNGFLQKGKFKMPFRKTFEYIYINERYM